MHEVINYHNGATWRRLDYLSLIELKQQADYLHRTPDAEWSEQGQYFLIKVNSLTDTWLKLQGL